MIHVANEEMLRALSRAFHYHAERRRERRQMDQALTLGSMAQAFDDAADQLHEIDEQRARIERAEA